MMKRKYLPFSDTRNSHRDFNILCNMLAWQHQQNPSDTKNLHITLSGEVSYTEPRNRTRVIKADINSLGEETVATFDNHDKIYFKFMRELFKNKNEIVMNAP